MVCPHCGQQHLNSTRFCPVSGLQIQSFECPRCGEVLWAGSQFCDQCGLNLDAPQEELLPTKESTSKKWLWIPLIFLCFVFLVGGGMLVFNRANEEKPNEPTPANPTSVKITPRTETPNSAWLTLTATASKVITRTPIPISTRSETATPTKVSAPLCTLIGQVWMRPLDKMEMVCIPAGSFTIGQRSCGYAGCEKEINGGSVSLQSYWIDRSEVTNAMFKAFVDETSFLTGAENSGASMVYGVIEPVPAADWRHPQGLISSLTGKENHPVVQLNWYAANAYCQWAGAKLPTEAQWEKAARGTDGRLFPWGNALPLAIYLNAADRNLPEPWSRSDQNDGYRYTAPVGSYPQGASPYGVMDLAGNAWEWTRSRYQDYPYQISDGRELSTEPALTDKIVLRGGCWYNDYGSVRSTWRYGGKPDQSTDGTGFRCAVP